MSSDPKLTVTAVVQMTLEVKVNGTWGGDCPMSQVHRQASEEAGNIVTDALVRGNPKASIKILGKTSIKAVSAERTN